MGRASERGFTLMEVLIAVGMIALLTVAGFGLSLSMKPMELSAATMQFDSTLESARSIAAAFSDGATVFVSTTPGSTNFRAQVYGNRPNGSLPLTPSTVPVLDSKATITETSVLHDPAFAIIIHGNGNIGARANFAAGDAPVGPELNCPSPQNALVFQFTVNGQTATRTLPCHIDLAASGPIILEPPPGASPGPVGVPFTPPVFSPAPVIRFPGCPSGTTFVLVTGNCRYPLTVSPTALRFFNVTDRAPGVYDSAGFLVNYDIGASVIATEKDYFRSYTVDTSQCSTMLSINPPSPLGPDTTGQGLSFAIQPVANPPAYNDCSITVANGNSDPSPSVLVSIAGPLVMKSDDGNDTVIPVAPSVGVTLTSTTTSWIPVTLDATKANYPLAVPLQTPSGCESNLQPVTIGLSPSGRTTITLQGLSTTFDAQGNDHPCSLTITDLPPTNLAQPDSTTISVSVGLLRVIPPPPTPPPPTPPPPPADQSGVVRVFGTDKEVDIGGMCPNPDGNGTVSCAVQLEEDFMAFDAVADVNGNLIWISPVGVDVGVHCISAGSINNAGFTVADCMNGFVNQNPWLPGGSIGPNITAWSDSLVQEYYGNFSFGPAMPTAAQLIAVAKLGPPPPPPTPAPTPTVPVGCQPQDQVCIANGGP